MRYHFMHSAISISQTPSSGWYSWTVSSRLPTLRLAGLRKKAGRFFIVIFRWLLAPSQQTALGKAHHGCPRDDEGIQHLHVDECQRLFQRLRQRFVRTAWFRQTRRMVMREDDRSGVGPQRALDDLPGINRRLRQGSSKKLLSRDQPVLGIQKQPDKDLVLL